MINIVQKSRHASSMISWISRRYCIQARTCIRVITSIKQKKVDMCDEATMLLMDQLPITLDDLTLEAVALSVI